MISYRHFPLLCSLLIFVFLLAGCANETMPVQSKDVNQIDSSTDAYDMPTTEQIATTSTSTTSSSPSENNITTTATTPTATTTGQSVPSTSSSSTRTAPPNAKIIPFTAGTPVREWEGVGQFEDDFCGKLIKDKTQFNALVNTHALGEEYKINQYNDDYFSSKAVVVLEFKLTSGSMRLQIDNVSQIDNTLLIQYTTIQPTPSTCDMAYWRILLEVNKNDVSNIEHIADEHIRVTLPSITATA